MSTKQKCSCTQTVFAPNMIHNKGSQSIINAHLAKHLFRSCLWLTIGERVSNHLRMLRPEVDKIFNLIRSYPCPGEIGETACLTWRGRADGYRRESKSFEWYLKSIGWLARTIAKWGMKWPVPLSFSNVLSVSMCCKCTYIHMYVWYISSQFRIQISSEWIAEPQTGQTTRQ